MNLRNYFKFLGKFLNPYNGYRDYIINKNNEVIFLYSKKKEIQEKIDQIDKIIYGFLSYAIQVIDSVDKIKIKMISSSQDEKFIIYSNLYMNVVNLSNDLAEVSKIFKQFKSGDSDIKISQDMISESLIDDILNDKNGDFLGLKIPLLMIKKNLNSINNLIDNISKEKSLYISYKEDIEILDGLIHSSVSRSKM